MHLDHGSSFELAMQALRTGYTSIMIDGSHSVFEENIALTKRVVDACAPSDVPVEAELGKVGGKEDDLDGGAGGYTIPEEAKNSWSKPVSVLWLWQSERLTEFIPEFQSWIWNA